MRRGVGVIGSPSSPSRAGIACRPSQVEEWLRDAGFAIDATLVMRPDGDRPGAVVFATNGSGPDGADA